MQQVINENKHYQIGIDKDQNRAFITIAGFWRNPEEVSEYLPDLDRALVQLQPGFTLLTDLSQMKTHPQTLNPVHLAAQQLLLSRGLTQTAEVVSSSIVQFQTESLSKQSAMPLRQFNSLEEASAYLDEISLLHTA
jgi:hypothetical protein